MTGFKVLNIYNSNIWNKYISELPSEQQDIYFTPQYYQLYEELGDGEARCFIYEEQDKLAMYPFLINSINKLGFDLDNDYYDIQGAYGYNGVVSNCYDKTFINNFYNAFNQFIIDKNIITEFTRFHPLLENNNFSNNSLDIIFNRKTVLINLNEIYDNIWEKSYSSVNRNMIRKAKKNKIEIKILTDLNDYKNFYNLYNKTMKHVNAEDYLYFNLEYFFNLKKYLLKNQFLIGSYYENKLISTSIIMINGLYCHYHLSCSDRNYSNLASTNLLLDFAITFSQDLGCKYFHLGGGSSVDGNDSLFKFKSNFSKNVSNFYIGKKVHNYEIYNKIVEQWENKNPDKIDKYKNFILKYRY